MAIRTGGIRGALGHRDFRHLLAGLAASQAGDWLYNVALVGCVFERTHSAGWVGATTIARIVPVIVLGPLGAALADRWDRRRVMVACDLARAAVMLALATAAATHLPVLVFPVLAALAAACSAPYPTCTAASTPRLVPPADLAGANAARSAVGMAAIAAGPAFGAVLLALGSPVPAFAINAGSFLLSAIAVGTIADRTAFRPGDHHRLRLTAWRPLVDLRVGLSALKARPTAAWLVGADVVCSLICGLQTVLLLVLARRVGLGAAGYGWLLAAIGVGGVLGTLGTGRAASGSRPRAVLGAALLAVSVALALMATGRPAWLLASAAVVSGAGAVLVEVLSETTLQRELGEAEFTRAYGVAFPASILGIVVGALVAAPLAATIGATGTLAGTAALAGIYAFLVLRHPALPTTRAVLN